MTYKVGLLAAVFAAAALAQAPKITGFLNMATLDNHYGPGSELVIYGTYQTPTAGRDYTITVGGVSGGINVAADGVFILATIPPTAPAGDTTLTISYLGAQSNALPIHVDPLDPELAGVGVTISGGQTPPAFNPYQPFEHATNSNKVTPTSPAATGEVISATVTGVGQQIPPGTNWTMTLSGNPVNIIQEQINPTSVTLYFGVPGSAPLGEDPVVVTVGGVPSNTAYLQVGAQPAISEIVNAANFRQNGTVAPGSIVTVFGGGFGSQDNASTFPSTNPNGVTVSFGGTPAPIFALLGNEGQLNVQVPNELQPGQTNVTVQDAGGTSAPYQVTVVPAAPGLFYYPDPLLPARHNAVAVTANTAWISMPLTMAATMGIPTNCSKLTVANLCAQPAHPGDYLQLYVTGLGVATPGGDPNGTGLATGGVAPASGNPLYQTVVTPTVTIGGQNAAVLFSGVAPGYNGLYQVDVQIPSNVATGDDVPITISSGPYSDSATISLASH